jgi:hypothetical protein
MPARVASLASRAEAKPSSRPYPTSSQRQTSVSERGRRRSSRREGALQPHGEGELAVAPGHGRNGYLASRSGRAGHRAAPERVLDACDAGELARGVDAREARLLRPIGDHAPFAHLAADETRKLQVRHQTVACREHVAVPGPVAAAVRERRAERAAALLGLAHPGSGTIARAGDPRGVAQALGDLRRSAPERGAEREQPSERRLLGDTDDARSGRGERGGHGEQQRARAGHDDAPPRDARAGLDERLRATDADDARQRPAWEGQEELARAGRQHEALEAHAARASRVLDQQPPFGRVDDRGARDRARAGARETREPGERRARRLAAVAPDLAARPGVRVDEQRARAGFRGVQRCGEAGRAAANDDHLGLERGSVARGPSTWPRRRSVQRDRHPLSHRREAGADVGLVVHGDAALEAGAHGAERAAPSTAHRRADRPYAVVPERGEQARVRVGFDVPAAEREADALSHGREPLAAGRRARGRSPAHGRA